MRRQVLLAIALAAAWSCSSAVLRKPDAPVPTPGMAKVNLAPVAFANQREVTRSPRLASTSIGKVAVSFPQALIGANRHTEIERLVRKALIERRLDVVAGENQAGVDATLVFDQLGTSGVVYDVHIAWNEGSRMFVATPGPAGAMPACPSGFRMKVPAFTARGRLVSTKDATILAEFEVKANLLERPQELGAPVDLVRYYPQPRRVRDVYRDDGGCNAEYHEYDYVASYEALDILCVEVQRKLAPHIPAANGPWERLEPGVEAAVNDLVAGIFGK